MKPKFDPALPIYKQLMDEFKKLIFKGRLAAGEKLAPVRELALQLGVNPNTLQRALSELEREGLVYAERTAGRFVSQDKELITDLREQFIAQAVGSLLAELAALGFTKTQALRLIQKYGGEQDE